MRVGKDFIEPSSLNLNIGFGAHSIRIRFAFESLLDTLAKALQS